MTAALAIIREAFADGVGLALTDAGTIRAAGNDAAVHRWQPLIRERKAEIVDLLRASGAGDLAVQPNGEPAAACPESGTASTWWRIFYRDREPVEVWTAPPATRAEVLEHRPDAVAAEPFTPVIVQSVDLPADDDIPWPERFEEPKRACSTCTHRPRGWLAIERAPCGEPVAAGLSDHPGVIRYSPVDGATCAAWQGCRRPAARRLPRSVARTCLCESRKPIAPFLEGGRYLGMVTPEIAAGEQL